jgi:hypothetical protein
MSFSSLELFMNFLAYWLFVQIVAPLTAGHNLTVVAKLMSHIQS